MSDQIKTPKPKMPSRAERRNLVLRGPLKGWAWRGLPRMIHIRNGNAIIALPQSVEVKK